MSGIAGHCALASEIEQLLGFRNDVFYYGSILPDIIAPTFPSRSTGITEPKIPRGSRYDRRTHRGKPCSKSSFTRPCMLRIPDPHYRRSGTYTLVPDLDRFWRETELTGFLKLGYAAHLLLDFFFLEEFCPQYIVGYTGLEFFTQEKIYRDYSRLNPLLLEQFNLDLVRINRVLQQEFFYIPIAKKGLQRNFSWINNCEKQPEPQYINLRDFSCFTQQAARRIITDANFCALANDLGC